MPQFNLDNYEMVKDRIPLFYDKYEDGRITCDILSDTAEGVTMKAYLWKNAEEQGVMLLSQQGSQGNFLVDS